jgi:hypothetical protein
MTLQSSGAISLNDVQTEHGGSNPIGINEYYGVAPGVPSSGTISLDDFYGTSNRPTITYVSGVEGDVSSRTSTFIVAPSGITSGDVSVLFVWVDATGNPTVSVSEIGKTWVKMGQTDTLLRPVCSAFYSLNSTGAASITTTSAGAMNAVRLAFRPSKSISSVTFSSGFERSASSYTHTESTPTDGSSYTYIHVFGVSGRPENNESVPGSISGSPTPIAVLTSIIASHARAYYSIFDPEDSSLPTYSYNNISDSGQQSSGFLWMGFQ